MNFSYDLQNCIYYWIWECNTLKNALQLEFHVFATQVADKKAGVTEA
jgi:hypothetical protein